MAGYKRFYASMLYIACRRQVLNETIESFARHRACYHSYVYHL